MLYGPRLVQVHIISPLEAGVHWMSVVHLRSVKYPPLKAEDWNTCLNKRFLEVLGQVVCQALWEWPDLRWKLTILSALAWGWPKRPNLSSCPCFWEYQFTNAVIQVSPEIMGVLMTGTMFLSTCFISTYRSKSLWLHLNIWRPFIHFQALSK